jgi:hypothetical protein
MELLVETSIKAIVQKILLFVDFYLEELLCVTEREANQFSTAMFALLSCIVSGNSSTSVVPKIFKAASYLHRYWLRAKLH